MNRRELLLIAGGAAAVGMAWPSNAPYGDLHINSCHHGLSRAPAYLFRSGRLPGGKPL